MVLIGMNNNESISVSNAPLLLRDAAEFRFKVRISGDTCFIRAAVPEGFVKIYWIAG
jgi:hypothetical protein